MNRARITYLIALPAAVLVLAGCAATTAHADAPADSHGYPNLAPPILPPPAGTTTALTDDAGWAADQVRTAEGRLLGAEVDGDTRTAGALLAPDFQQVDVTGTAETRADYLANIGGGIDFVALQPIEPISVRVYGGTAVARLKLNFKVAAHGQTLQHEGWTTDIFEQRDGRWQLVW